MNHCRPKFKIFLTHRKFRPHTPLEGNSIPARYGSTTSCHSTKLNPLRENLRSRTEWHIAVYFVSWICPGCWTDFAVRLERSVLFRVLGRITKMWTVGQSIVLCKWQTIEVAVLVRKLCLEREKCAFCATVWCDPHSLPSLHVYIFAGAICEFPKHSVNFARVGEAAKARKLLAERAICQRGWAARKRHEHGQQRRPGLRCREDYLEARSQGEYGARAPTCPRAACLVTLQGALQLRETCENQRNLHCLEFCLFLVGCRLRAKSVGRRYDISCVHGGWMCVRVDKQFKWPLVQLYHPEIFWLGANWKCLLAPAYQKIRIISRISRSHEILLISIFIRSSNKFLIIKVLFVKAVLWKFEWRAWNFPSVQLH